MGCPDATTTLALPPLEVEGNGYRKCLALRLSIQLWLYLCLHVSASQNILLVPPWGLGYTNSGDLRGDENPKNPRPWGCSCHMPGSLHLSLGLLLLKAQLKTPSNPQPAYFFPANNPWYMGILQILFASWREHSCRVVGWAGQSCCELGGQRHGSLLPQLNVCLVLIRKQNCSARGVYFRKRSRLSPPKLSSDGTGSIFPGGLVVCCVSH